MLNTTQVSIAYAGRVHSKGSSKAAGMGCDIRWGWRNNIQASMTGPGWYHGTGNICGGKYRMDITAASWISFRRDRDDLKSISMLLCI